jgi:hypoxanthine phosphoribosyltransferase
MLITGADDGRGYRYRGHQDAVVGFQHGTLFSNTTLVRLRLMRDPQLGSKISHGGLLGKRILVVDEIDDSRKTLSYVLTSLQSPALTSQNPSYALKELIKDVTQQLELVQDPTERARLAESTKFGIFVVHNKLKEKAAEIPEGVAYFSGMDIPDVWVDYPWCVPLRSFPPLVDI